MEWSKRLPAGAASRGGWREDFPLDATLPGRLRVELDDLREPVNPMFAVRLQVFMDWHRRLGRKVDLQLPTDPQTRGLVRALGLDGGTGKHADVLLPITRIDKFDDVESVSGAALEAIESERDGVAISGQPAYMAISEFGNNAVEHGANDLGAYAAVCCIGDPRPHLAIAISDLGIGIPEHIRQQHPEWADDGYAIARATEAMVSGTGDVHRGNGFDAVFDESLVRATQEATIDVLSANGFFRMRLCEQRRHPETFPASNYRRGTWITAQVFFI